MIYFDRNFNLAEGQFYTVQNMAGVPTLPVDKVIIGQGYNLFATGFADLTEALPGSISFQYVGNDVLVEGRSETELGIHFWNGSQWQALKTDVDTYFNLASARSQGPGIYALLAGVTTPEINTVVPSAATNEVTNTLVISGGYFLPPLEVALAGPTATYILQHQWVSTSTLTAVVTQGLPAREYQVVVANLNQPGPAVSNPGTFALYNPAEACFYDFFESGASKWQTGGDWGIVILPSGERAMTDSPVGPYKSAGDYGSGIMTFTTAITSQAFSLNDCADPVLTFRHDYVIDNRSPSQDVGRVGISTDDGATWAELNRYQGGDVFDLGTQDVESPEWSSVNWQAVQLSLSAYTGTVRLRFSLEVDQVGADKGWVFDNVRVQSGPAPGPGSGDIFMPIILKEE
jgi:hypothetical protein